MDFYCKTPYPVYMLIYWRLQKETFLWRLQIHFSKENVGLRILQIHFSKEDMGLRILQINFSKENY